MTISTSGVRKRFRNNSLFVSYFHESHSHSIIYDGLFLQKRLRALKLLNFVEDYNTSYYYLISLWIIQVTSTQFRCRLYKLILFNFLDALPDPSNFDAISQSNSTLTVVCCSSNNSRTFCPMTENIFKSCVKKKGMQGWELSVKGKSIQRSKAREQSEQLWRESK